MGSNNGDIHAVWRQGPASKGFRTTKARKPLYQPPVDFDKCDVVSRNIVEIKKKIQHLNRLQSCSSVPKILKTEKAKAK